MTSRRNGVHYLFDNAHVRSKLYWEFFHGTVYLTYEGHILNIENEKKKNEKDCRP